MLRHHEVTRIEGFSDAVFGFALTLLVVQLEVPKTSDELLELVKGSVPFAVTFAMVCYIWWEHNKFFRRYGLQDAWTAFLNSVLLFVVLFYVYPMKFLATALLGNMAHMKEVPPLGDGRLVMLLYSAGAASVFALFILLYQHAWQQREKLGLDPAARLTLRFNRRAHLISAALAVVSLGLSAVIHKDWLAIPGLLYGLMGPLHAWNGFSAGKAHAALEKAGSGQAANA